MSILMFINLEILLPLVLSSSIKFLFLSSEHRIHSETKSYKNVLGLKLCKYTLINNYIIWRAS